ncbi:hypothetical protein Pint_19191 [Pistacia integerrima]|uniref:Uncharacterized protein n=1 Tax=Pistacia integerrima TaxID=434235 RepID=A0ACC0YW19_9ROSI|nr:hypothetical protein Pint_19191 [Pistacia integerrima]
MIINGFNSNPSALRELIFCSAMVVSGAMNYAHKVFTQITEPDTFMYNTMIRGSAQSLTPLNAILLYTQMEKCCIKPDNFTFSFVLKACTRVLFRNMGFCVHGKVVKHGGIFDASEERDVVAWSALTAGYARRGELSVARSLFDAMPAKDLVSWNVMITGYVMCGLNKCALEMFEEMRVVGERPDEVTMLSLLSACADMGDLEVGKKIHCALLEVSSGDIKVLLGNALIDMYGKCGSIERAMEVFHGMKEKDDSTWNSVIIGLAFHGYAEESITLFSEMQRLKVRPNEITFVGVLVACSHAGKVEEGKRYFKLMQDVYNIEPNIRHYGCMVDLLGRAGLLNETFEFIDDMKIKPNAIIWRTLLGACKIHGNVELGRRANERLLKLRRDESGDYVLLSNIYASQGEWDGAEKVRNLMDGSGVWKEPGRSLVEADDKALTHYLLNSKPKLDRRDPVR